MRKIFLFFLSLDFAFSCALCALQTPTAHIKIDFEFKNQTINIINYEWIFSSNFTQSLLESYDENDNDKIDKNELNEIKRSLLMYLANKNYLLELGFYDKNSSDFTNIKPKNIALSANLKDEKLIFNFALKTNIALKENRIIKMHFFDDEGFFNFSILNDEVRKNGDFILNANANLNSVFFEISKITNEAMPIKPKAPENGILSFISSKLQSFLKSIENLFISSKNSPLSLLMLCFFSFLYGLFHAAIPGHGKMLVGSFFLANGGSYKRAFLLCLKIGFIHVTGAFLLVFLSINFVKIFLNSFVQDAIFYTNIIASFIIITLGFYLLKNKLTSCENGCKCHFCNGKIDKYSQKNSLIFSKNSYNPHEKITHFFDAKHLFHDKIHAKNQSKKEFLLALSAGIVPCPGTIAVFILAFSLGNFLSGFLSALSMAFGMSVVIFVMSLFGTFLHKKVEKQYTKYLRLSEFFGIFMLLVLGFLMFFLVLKDNL